MDGLSVELRNVSFAYEPGKPVLRDLSLTLGPGLTLVVGPNGCGKSTLLKLAAGVEPPDSGRILVAGRDLWHEESGARRTLAYVPEVPDVSPYASVLEVLRLVAALRNLPPAQAHEALKDVGLEGMASSSIRQLSKGQRRRVLYAAARIGEPPILLLDEPLDGMDAGTSQKMMEWIRAHLTTGGMVVVSTHLWQDFEPLAVRVLEMDQGSIQRSRPGPGR